MRIRLVAVFVVWSMLVVCLGSALAQTTKPKAAAQPAQKAQAPKTTSPDDAYPRPPKPAKQYMIGLSVPQD